MANNITVKDASGSNVVIRTTDVGAGIEANMSIPTNTAGVAADFGPGTGGTTTTPRMIIDSSQLGSLGQAAATASAPVVPATNWVYNQGYYVAVAASQTGAVLQSSTGAIGDYLDHIIVFPATTAAGNVLIIDNSTTVGTYPGGGTTALLTLTPFTIYVGAVSRSGAWKVTTGANVSILAVGRFS